MSELTVPLTLAALGLIFLFFVCQTYYKNTLRFRIFLVAGAAVLIPILAFGSGAFTAANCSGGFFDLCGLYIPIHVMLGLHFLGPALSFMIGLLFQPKSKLMWCLPASVSAALGAPSHWFWDSDRMWVPTIYFFFTYLVLAPAICLFLGLVGHALRYRFFTKGELIAVGNSSAKAARTASIVAVSVFIAFWSYPTSLVVIKKNQELQAVADKVNDLATLNALDLPQMIRMQPDTLVAEIFDPGSVSVAHQETFIHADAKAFNNYVQVSPNGKMLATMDSAGLVRIFDQDGERATANARPQGKFHRIPAMLWSPDSKTLLYRGCPDLKNAQDDYCNRQIVLGPPYTEPAELARYSRYASWMDTDHILTGPKGGYAVRIAIADNSEDKLRGPKGFAKAIAYSPATKLFAVIKLDGTLVIHDQTGFNETASTIQWEGIGKKEKGSPREINENSVKLLWSPDGNFLLVFARERYSNNIAYALVVTKEGQAYRYDGAEGAVWYDAK